LKKKILLETFFVLVLGGLTSLSLPPFNFFLINFFTLSIFFVFLFKKLNISISKKVFFYYGWLFGFSFFLSSLYWITISLTFDESLGFLITITLILIPSFLSLFYGLITLIFYLFKAKNILSAFFLFSFLFGVIDFIRGTILTGLFSFIFYMFCFNFLEFFNF
jgi:apolipoprotein N-acyltransferase